MTTTEKQTPTEASDKKDKTDKTATMEKLEELLDEWRGRIDDLLVRADLASKDVSEAARTNADAAQNAYLAAKNQLQRIPKDAGANIGALRSGVEKLIDDLRHAYESAEAALRRGRSH